MKALSYRGPGVVRIVDKPRPRIEHPNDVDPARDARGDLRLRPAPLPRPRPRHARRLHLRPRVRRRGRGGRLLGVADAASGRPRGGAVQHLLRHLLLLPARADGNCENTNPDSDVAVGGVFGYSHTTGGYDGGQAEYVRVPFADVGPMKIPDDMDDEDGALPHRHPPHRLPGRGDGRDQERRHGGRVRLRARSGLFATKSRVAAGRGPRDRGRPPRLPARLRASGSRRCETVNFKRGRRHRRAPQEA